MNQKRFAAALPLIIVVLLVIVGVGGYLAFGPKMQVAQPTLVAQPNSEPTSTLIEISVPKAGELISSPLIIKGIANVGWTVFEGVAGTATLYDGRNRQLGWVQLKATSDWTKPPVQFEATMEWQGKIDTDEGRLEFLSDNPSGDPAKQKTYAMSVEFATSTTDISNWRIYVNNQFGLAFKYPPELGSPQEIAIQGFQGITTPYHPISFGNKLILTLGVASKPTNIDNLFIGENHNKITIGGRYGIEVSSTQIGTIALIQLSSDRILQVEGPYNNSLMDQILSTFRLISQ